LHAGSPASAASSDLLRTPASGLKLRLVVLQVAVFIRTGGQNCRVAKATQQEMQKVYIQHAKSMFVGIQKYWKAPHFEAPSNIDLLLKFGDVRNLHN
jgi:hypothetical protein